MRIPGINILGAIIGTFLGYSVTTYRSSKSLVVENVLKVSYFKHMIKPLMASSVMAFYLYFIPFIASISLIPTIISAGLIYIVIMDFSGAIDAKKVISALVKKVA